MQTDAFRRLKFELCEYLRLYDAGLKKRANAHLKGAVRKFKSEFSEAERDYVLGELCREILDESESELKNLKNRGNGELSFRLGELASEYLKKSLHRRPNAASTLGISDLRARLWEGLKRMSFCAVHTIMSAATREP